MRYQIASNIHLDEIATFGDVARKCGLAESETRRLLRNAMTMRVFQEPQPGTVAHTAASSALSKVPMLTDWVGLLLDEMWPAQTKARLVLCGQNHAVTEVAR